MSKKQQRTPEEYRQRGEWNYTHTLTAEGGRTGDLLKALEIEKFDQKPTNIQRGRMESVHPMLIGTDPVIIDFYHGRYSQTETPSFRAQHGSTLTLLLQAGYDPQKWKLTQEKSVTSEREQVRATDATLDF